METLTITRVCEDTDNFQIELLAKKGQVSARTRSYTTAHLINELAVRLARFPLNHEDRYIWENGARGIESSAAVSLEFKCDDKLGIIAIEVLMDMDNDYDPRLQKCRINTRTKIGSLNEFGRSLAALNQSGAGHAVTLRRN